MTAKTAQPVKSCSILLTSATLDPPNVSELKTQLESSHDDMKILAMKKIIMSSMAGKLSNIYEISAFLSLACSFVWTQ